jgi:hypothetical protein
VYTLSVSSATSTYMPNMRAGIDTGE